MDWLAASAWLETAQRYIGKAYPYRGDGGLMVARPLRIWTHGDSF